MKLCAVWPSSVYFKGNKQLMAEYSAKKGINGMIVPRKGIGDPFRDTADAKHRNGPLCSRPGCSGRVKPPKVDKAGSSGKGKALKYSFRSSSSGKEAVGSSSRTTNNPGKSLIEPQKTLSSCLETDSSETSSIQDEPISGLIPSPENFTGGLRFEVENVESDKVKVMEIGSSSVASKTRYQRNFHQKAGLCSQETKISGPVTHAATSRYGLRNLRCNSVSDVIPSSCSSSDSNLNKRKDIIKRRNCEGECSSNARGKKMTGSSFEGRNSGARNGISISDSRRSRNIPSHQDSSIASVRTRRFNSAHARGRLSSQVNENHVTTIESPVMTPPSPHSGDLNAPGILYHNHTFSDTRFSRPSSYSRPGTGSEQFCGVRLAPPAEFNLINRNSFRRHNMDGIAEVFLALERIERDGELTHEQILLLETNLLLNGLNFFDHHRDMRLDIDNMSYEELLALEDRMGSVSTALTEEALSECLKRSIYQSAPTDDAAKSFKEDKDDIKCCICQEEYVVGDEVGILQCQHKYHVVCVQQWLRLKNWCPICKVSAASSNSSSRH